jgi:branched-chain amino acid aminotransferase
MTRHSDLDPPGHAAMTMTNLCSIDGRLRSLAEATIPVMDRGFLFGDSVYEVLRTHKGRFLCLDRHLRRLRSSAQALRFELPLSDRGFEDRVRQTVEASDNAESYVRIIVTRGVNIKPDIDPDFTVGVPSVVIMVRQLDQRVEPPVLHTYSACLVMTRRNDRRALDPAIKSGNYLNNILGLMEAKQRGAQVALFLNSEGHLTEAPTANVWLVRNGEILTPPLTAGILLGITRELLLEVGARDGLPVAERDLTEEDVRAADELFLSSTLRDVAPITELDGKPVGNGQPGPVAIDLNRRYLAECDRLVGL